ncbi:MAG TPA: hypothetical protein VF681_15840 [Abditibacteriaceae bacterium]|jgi:hypothetical protein
MNEPFGNGPLAHVLAEAIRALLAPIVVVSALAGLLLGLQRNYTSLMTALRSANARRRRGDARAERVFAVLHQSACRQARVIMLVYAGAASLLLSSCATAVTMFIPARAWTNVIAWLGLFCFAMGLMLPLYAMTLLLRDAGAALRSVQEEF